LKLPVALVRFARIGVFMICNVRCELEERITAVGLLALFIYIGGEMRNQVGSEVEIIAFA